MINRLPFVLLNVIVKVPIKVFQNDIFKWLVCYNFGQGRAKNPYIWIESNIWHFCLDNQNNCKLIFLQFFLTSLLRLHCPLIPTKVMNLKQVTNTLFLLKAHWFHKETVHFTWSYSRRRKWCICLELCCSRLIDIWSSSEYLQQQDGASRIESK